MSNYGKWTLVLRSWEFWELKSSAHKVAIVAHPWIRPYPVGVLQMYWHCSQHMYAQLTSRQQRIAFLFPCNKSLYSHIAQNLPWNIWLAGLMQGILKRPNATIGFMTHIQI